MNLQQHVAGWIQGAEWEWKEIHERLPMVLERARGGPARLAVEGWDLRLRDPLLATPLRVAVELSGLVPIVDRAVAEEQQRLPNEGAIGFALLGLLDLGNTLDCVGCPLDPSSWDTMRGWVSRVRVSRDSERVPDYWTAGFAALALGDRHTYCRIAGYIGGVPAEPDPSFPTEPRGRFSFQPGRIFQFNMQGLLRYLAGAVEQGAAFEDVVPAWEDLLGSYPVLRESKSLDPGTLLWIARVIFHRIGGHSLGEVAQRLHDSAWALAGLEP